MKIMRFITDVLSMKEEHPLQWLLIATVIFVAVGGCENKSQACADKYGLAECVRRACAAYVDPYDQMRCVNGDGAKIGATRANPDWWK